MKKKISILLALICILSSFSFGANADVENNVISDNTISSEEVEDIVNSPNANYIPNEIVITTDYLVDLSQFETGDTFDFHGVSITDIEPLFFETTEEEIAERIEKMGYCFQYLIRINTQAITADEALSLFANNEHIICAEQNYTFHVECEPIEDIQMSPIDTNINSTTSTGAIDQWAHTYLGMTNVWATTFVGSSNVRVAVLDTGFVQNSDLENNLNMSLAYNAYNQTTDVYPNMGVENYNHGNMVAGIICADYDDGGVNGICKNVTIIPIKIVDEDNLTSPTILATAINRAIYLNADIVNISFALNNPASYYSTMRNSINSAQLLTIVAAGNNGGNMGTSGIADGAKHNDAYFIFVGASNQNESKRSTSNYSSLYCDIFAPGSEIATTNISGTISASGTSYAAPHVTAACALIMSKATHLTPAQVKSVVMNSAKQVRSSASGDNKAYDTYCVSKGILSITNIVNNLYNENRGVYGNYTRGDVNNDGYVNNTDYILAKRIYNDTYNATIEQENAADINQNGLVDSTDVLLLQRYYYRTYYFTP